MNLSLKALFSACHVIANASGAHLSSMGISGADFKITCGDAPWTVSQRSRVMKTLEALIYGMLDNLGLPRFSVPAEYMAGIIAMFVAPANIMVATRWVEATPPADALAIDAENATSEKVTARQLFALVVQALDDSVQLSAFREKFEARTNLRLTKLAKNV